MNSDSPAASGPVSQPAGDIGNHVLPEAIVIVSGALVLLAVIVRLLARHMMKRMGIADILLVISLGFFIAHHYNAYQAAIYPGLGVHQWQFNPELAAASHYNFKLGSVTFGLNIVFLKIAILLDWIHTFVPTGTRNGLFWILVVLIASNAVFYFIGTFIEAFQCPPQDTRTPGCNIDVVKYNVASGIINVVSDLTILTAPHWVIWKLHMSRARKMGVSVLFIIGALATGSAIGRVVYVARAYDTGDILFHSVPINLWAIAEETFGYLVIGIPSIPKVLRDSPCARHFGSMARSKRQGTNPSGYPERGSTWPSSASRRYRNPWETEEETDTHVLVTVVGGEGKDIPLPDRARMYKEQDGRNSSAEGVGMAIS
ncbi:putative integral membrane protein PTH11 [Rosellinia necatrix]|uniref:Putative integral membrane protein PTH11 n=1 Tax=Rosellinia necatrix TaxID=77044 RepID=A0A1W2TJ12_ROSNE|nr:putative integral membrane protein PTH11 [Rosellinia necatrix]